MANVKDVKEALKQYRMLSMESDRAQDLWDEDPYNEELEKAADDTYRIAYEALGKVTSLIMDLIGTDAKTARTMVLKDRKLDALLARAR